MPSKPTAHAISSTTTGFEILDERGVSLHLCHQTIRIHVTLEGMQ